MRFTSVLSLIMFIRVLGECGYTCSLSEAEIKELFSKKDYVSEYILYFGLTEHNLLMRFVNKRGAVKDITLWRISKN